MTGLIPNKPKKRREWRRHCKKSRRQKIRRAAAQLRDEQLARENKELESSSEYRTWLRSQKELEEKAEEDERLQREKDFQMWMERERKSQEEWVRNQDQRNKAIQVKERKDKLIREEWEKRKLEEELERQARNSRVEEQSKLQEAWLGQLNSYLNSDSEVLPEFLANQSMTQTGDPEGEMCSFFTKTGACRFGDLCSRKHVHPTISKTLLVPSFYNHYGLNKAFRDEFSSDGHLEFEEGEIYEHFREFHQDVLQELQSIGNVVQLKVCCNLQAHLRGNVYVQFGSQKEAVRAFLKLQGRWYDGRQLVCRFVNIASWRTAICGLFLKGKCPKGRLCNFLHVFRSPHGLFRELDRDFSSRYQKGPTDNEAQSGKSGRLGNASSPLARNSPEWRWSPSPPLATSAASTRNAAQAQEQPIARQSLKKSTTDERLKKDLRVSASSSMSSRYKSSSRKRDRPSRR